MIIKTFWVNLGDTITLQEKNTFHQQDKKDRIDEIL